MADIWFIRCNDIVYKKCKNILYNKYKSAAVQDYAKTPMRSVEINFMLRHYDYK